MPSAKFVIQVAVISVVAMLAVQHLKDRQGPGAGKSMIRPA